MPLLILVKFHGCICDSNEDVQTAQDDTYSVPTEELKCEVFLFRRVLDLRSDKVCQAVTVCIRSDIASIRVIRPIKGVFDEEVYQCKVDQHLDDQPSPDYGSWLLLLVTEKIVYDRVLLCDFSLTVSLSSIFFVECPHFVYFKLQLN